MAGIARYQTGRVKSMAAATKRAQKWGIVVMAVVGVGIYFRADIAKVAATPSSAMKFLYLALLLVTFVYLGLFVILTDQEFDLLDRWLDGSYAPPGGFVPVLLIVGLGASLAILLATANDPVWYSIAYLVFTMVLYWGVRSGHRMILDASRLDRKVLEADFSSPELRPRVKVYRDALDAIDEYWRPDRHLFVKKLAFLGGACGLVVALYARVTGVEWARAGFYVWFVILYVSTEVPVYRWRLKRDGLLQGLSQKRLELERALEAEGWRLGHSSAEGPPRVLSMCR